MKSPGILSASIRLAAVLALASTPALCAKEFVLLPPTEVTFEKEQVWFENTIGPDWLEPVNYADGECHIRLVTIKRPRPCTVNPYVFWDGKGSFHGALTNRTPIGATGEMAFNQGVISEQWHSHPWNFRNMGPRWRLLIKDGKALHFLSKEEQQTYLPLVINATVVFVPKGGTFSGWDNYPIEPATGAIAKRRGDGGSIPGVPTGPSHRD